MFVIILYIYIHSFLCFSDEILTQKLKMKNIEFICFKKNLEIKSNKKFTVFLSQCLKKETFIIIIIIIII